MAKTVAVLIARLIFGCVFAMAATFKFLGMGDTAAYIAAAGFPLALALAWVAAFFESALTIALWTGAFFSEAALLAATYILFLAFAFHGPSHWSGRNSASSWITSPSLPGFSSRRFMDRAAFWSLADFGKPGESQARMAIRRFGSALKPATER